MMWCSHTHAFSPFLRIKYLVSWEGYSAEANTWEPAQQLLEDVPDLVNEFEAKFTK